MNVEIYTDGACSKSGVGGFAAIMFVDGVRIDSIYGGQKHTTNNRMELWGVLGAMRLIPRLQRLYCNNCGLTKYDGSELASAILKACPEGAGVCADYGKKVITQPMYPNPTVLSDSQYVVNGCSTWLSGWKSNGWKTYAKKDVLNKDLWELIDLDLKVVAPSFKWVKGHNGNPGNELADQLAVQALNLTHHGIEPSWISALGG